MAGYLDPADEAVILFVYRAGDILTIEPCHEAVQHLDVPAAVPDVSVVINGPFTQRNCNTRRKAVASFCSFVAFGSRSPASCSMMN